MGAWDFFRNMRTTNQPAAPVTFSYNQNVQPPPEKKKVPPEGQQQPPGWRDVLQDITAVDPATAQDTQQNALWNALYQTAGRGFETALDSSVSPDQLFQSAVAQARPEYERATRQVESDLQRLGLTGQGAAGYTEGTPWANVQDSWQKNLLNMGMQAEIAAPQMNMQNLMTAAQIGAPLQAQRQGQIEGYHSNLYGAEQDAWQREQMGKAQDQGLWGSIGQSALGTLGTLGGMALAPMTGGLSMPLGGMIGGLFGGGGNSSPTFGGADIGGASQMYGGPRQSQRNIFL